MAEFNEKGLIQNISGDANMKDLPEY